MPSFNKVILMGNLTRDPELRVTTNGLSICKISLATNRVFNSQDGERREEVTFVDVDAFGRQAEIISKYMAKGRPILIEGRLKRDSWETQQGEKRSKLFVVLERFQFMGGREDSADSGGHGSHVERSSPPPRPSREPAAPASSPPQQRDEMEEDDVPF